MFAPDSAPIPDDVDGWEPDDMRTIEQGYRSVSLIMTLGRDRALFMAGLAGALWLGAQLGTLAG